MNAPPVINRLAAPRWGSSLWKLSAPGHYALGAWRAGKGAEMIVKGIWATCRQRCGGSEEPPHCRLPLSKISFPAPPSRITETEEAQAEQSERGRFRNVADHAYRIEIEAVT